jgi:hypothetical protein
MPIANLLEEPIDPLTSVEGAVLAGFEEYVRDVKRNEIRQILKSYHQTYDHFHEALQNAMDACERVHAEPSEGGSAAGAAPYEPYIEVHVDVDNNRFTVKDNGIGMDLNEVKRYFFTPYATQKPSQHVRQRGEKGVGNTFLAYGSQSYYFSTRHKGEQNYISGRIDGGVSWALGEVAQMPLVVPDNCHSLLENEAHGTVVEIQFSEMTNIKRLADHGTSLEHWETILRLHTGVGYIDFGDNDEFLGKLRVSLYVNYQGTTKSRIVRKGYLYPHKVEGVTSVRGRDLARDARGKLPPKHTMKQCIYDFFDAEAVRQKAMAKLEKYSRFGPYRNELRDDLNRFKPKAYVCFSWSSDLWGDMNAKIFGRDSGEFDHGMVFTTKSQRLAEPKKIDFVWRTGDYNRFLLVLDVEHLEADIGRKSLDRRAVNIGNLIADAFQDQFVDLQDALKPSPRARREEEEIGLEKLIDNAIESGTDLPIPKLALLKEPREEQDVIALFFNLLGIGYLKGYRFYCTLVSKQYDGVGYFELASGSGVAYNATANPLGIPTEHFGKNGVRRSTKRNFIEFKISTDDLVHDIRIGDKLLKDIKWLVCWDIGENHIKEGIGIDEILDEQQRGHREFYGVTHLMKDNVGSTVHVICLKKVVEILSRELRNQ